MLSSKVKTHWFFDFSHLDALKKSWDELAHLQEHSLFFTFAWFQSVITWLPPHSKIIVWVAEQDHKVIGIIPLLLKRTHDRKIPIRQVEWLRVPDSHFCGVLAAPAEQSKILKLLWQDLKKSPFKWDKCKLYPVTSTLKDAIDHSSCPFRFSSEVVTEHPWIDLTCSWQNYYQTRTRRLKKGNNHLANRLQEQGRLSLQHLTSKTQGLRPETLVEHLTQVSGDSWKVKTKTTFNHAGPAQFLRAITEQAFKHQWLSTWHLYLEDKLIAAEYQLIENKIVYALRADFDENYRDLSPGSYLNWKIIESLFEQGLERYYMGPGRNSYKERWQNHSDPVYNFTCYSNNFKGRLLNSINTRIIPSLKPFAQKLSPAKHKEPQE